MTDVLLRRAEGCDPDYSLLWDSLWQPQDGEADWAIAGAGEAYNRGGLAAQDMLATAVVLALFTDQRIDPDHPLAYLADGETRGWWGDGADVRVDLHERALGSHLWLLERAPLTLPDGMQAATWAEHFAREALQVLIDQGAVARVDVAASQDERASRLNLLVRLYGRDGGNVYDRRFDLVWRQLAR